MDILEILHKLVEHSTLNGAEKAELHGHVDALVEPEAAPGETPETPEGA